MKRIVIEVDEHCNDCLPYVEAMSIDGRASAYCKKSGRPLPADGKVGTEIMCMKIPSWCELPDVEPCVHHLGQMCRALRPIDGKTVHECNGYEKGCQYYRPA
jgi:hypothetical protein